MESAFADPPITRTAGKYERLCWERHARDLALCGQPAGHPKGFRFDPESGMRVTAFVESYCTHYEGEWAGQPLLLEGWQKDIIQAAFGWLRRDGTRRYRTVYIEIPRKNGKSTWAGGVGLYLTVADGEAGAQVYVTATKKDQARIVWGAADKMLRRSARLRKFVKASKLAIYCERLGSRMEPLGANSDTQDGFNAHAQLVDEAHAHKDRHVYDVVATSMGARRQPLNWIITTAGVYNPESIGWELHERAIQVLEGVIEDDTFFAYIAAADAKAGENASWQLPETWASANPNLGVSVKFDYLTEQCDRAKTTPSFLNTFLRYHLNIWTQQIERWISIDKWNACERVVDPEQLRGRVCCAGLDLSSKIDLTALVLAFPDGDATDFLFHFWMPKDVIEERTEKDRVPYDAWVRDGWITATPGNVVDYSFICAAVQDAAKKYDLREVAYDPWNATQTAVDLQEEGITVVELRQGYASLSEPSKEFEKLIVAAKLGHLTPRGPNPVMRWMVSNVAIKRDPAGNIKPDKSSTKGRIDGVIGSIMSLGRASVLILPPKPQVLLLNDSNTTEPDPMEAFDYDES